MANTLKEVPEDSIFEHLHASLKEIQTEKTWSKEEVAKEFSALITKPPPVVQM